MDLDTEVAVTPGDESIHLVALQLAKGNAVVTHKSVRHRTFTVKNSGDGPKKILLEYPVQENWQLVEPKEPAEKTRKVYRFALTAEPGKPATLPIREEYATRQEVALTNWDDKTIAFYVAASEVSGEVKQALASLVKRKAEIAKLASKRSEQERQITVIKEEQARIRSNLSEITKGSDLARRYEAKLTKQEDEIEKLREQVSANVAQEATLKANLDAYLLDLDLK
jgi:hypothetical protein